MRTDGRTDGGSSALDAERATALYRTMRLIRRFEERVVDLVNANEIAGVTHEYVGQEAVATGVCEALEEHDIITSTHRGHGHLLARGADPKRMMAELLSRTTGLNRAHGGSMHIADFSLGIYGANGIVAAGAPIASGGVWAKRRQGIDAIGVTFFGDGAINQGILHETMNLAAIWKIPLIFLCENNGYAVSMSIERASCSPIAERVQGYGFPVEVVDGMDVAAVHEAAASLASRARAEATPAFLECQTYRFVGHHTAERTQGLTYRTDAEIERWRLRDPLTTWPTVLEGRGWLSADERQAMDVSVEDELDAAIAYARSSPLSQGPEALAYQYAGERPAGFPSWGAADA